MTARLERDVGRGSSALVARRAQGKNFGMRFASAFVPSLAYTHAITYQYTTYPWVGVGRPLTALS